MPESSFWPSAADWRLFAASLAAAVGGFGAWFLGHQLFGWWSASDGSLIFVFAIVLFAAVRLVAGYRSAR